MERASILERTAMPQEYGFSRSRYRCRSLRRDVPKKQNAQQARWALQFHKQRKVF